VTARLVIEIDGPEHNAQRRRHMDAEKQRDLERQGYQVQRFTNESVVQDPVGVWKNIAATLSRTPPGEII
jgi:very-short-patch-repair endonuclease